jgi:HSP20 family protein
MSPQSATAMQHTKDAVPIKQTPSIFHRIEELHNSIARRAFEIFEGKGRWPGRELDDWLRAESEFIHPMHLEITESDNYLNVRAEVPGFNAKELEIITGKHEVRDETKKGKTLYSELCAAEILRVVDLPAEVDTSDVSATLKDGILSIKMTKTATPKSVRVDLKNA